MRTVIVACIIVSIGCLMFVTLDYFQATRIYDIVALFLTFNHGLVEAEYEKVETFLMEIEVKIELSYTFRQLGMRTGKSLKSRRRVLSREKI